MTKRLRRCDGTRSREIAEQALGKLPHSVQTRRYFAPSGGFELVSIVAITDIPGRNRSAREGSCSSTIFTGIRCTTLVKLPVALSGGSSANSAPDAGDQLSTCPCRTLPGKASTVTRAFWPARIFVI